VESRSGGFFEPPFDKSEREARAEDGDIKLAQDVGERAMMIFVAVRQKQWRGRDGGFVEIGDVPE